MKYRIEMIDKGYSLTIETPFATLNDAKSAVQLVKPGGVWVNDIQYVDPKSLPGDEVWAIISVALSPREKWLNEIATLETRLERLRQEGPPT